MSALWQKVRPHVLAWHMVPCLVMLAAAVGVAVATGQPSRVLGAVACMVMMMVMIGAMGGHDHGGHDDGPGPQAGPPASRPAGRVGLARGVRPSRGASDARPRPSARR